MMKIRIGYFLVILILIFSACSFKEENYVAETDKKEKRKYDIVVSSSVSDYGIKGIEELCNKANQLSNGEIVINYKTTDNALDEFYSGADFIFASNDDIARANGNFSSYTSPFYFFDSEDALLTLNSDKFIKQTSDVTQSLINAKQMGCYYDGSHIIISSKVNNLFSFNENKEISLFDNLRVYGSFNYNDEFLLSDMGVNILDCDDLEAVEKFNSAYSHTIMIKKDLTDKIILPDKRQSIYYYNSPFKLDFNWLFISDSLMQEIKPEALEIIKEAVSYSIGLNDELVLNQELVGYENLEKYPIENIDIQYLNMYSYAENLFDNDIKFRKNWDTNNHKQVRNILYS